MTGKHIGNTKTGDKKEDKSFLGENTDLVIQILQQDRFSGA